MAKKSVIAGEYIIEIADNGHVDVLRIHRNAKATMEEIAERKAFPVKKSWNTRALGANLVKEFGDGKTAQFDGITLTRLDDGSIEVQEHFKSTIEVLRQIADKVGCRYEEGWNTQRLGSKLTDYLEEHKDKVDKFLTTPNKKRQGETTQGQHSKFAVSKRASSFLTFDAPLLITEFSDPITEDNAEGIKELMQDKSFGVLVVREKRIEASLNNILYHSILQGYVGTMQDNIAKAQEFVATSRANDPDRYKEKNFYFSYTTKIEQYDWLNLEQDYLVKVLGYFFQRHSYPIIYWPFDGEAVKSAVKLAASIEGYRLLAEKRTWRGVETDLYLDCTPAETEELIVAIRAGVK